MSYGQVNADVIGTSVAGSNLGAGDASLMKSRIINGAMVISQAQAGASTTALDSYPVDRFKYEASQTSKLTLQQNAGSVTPPVGFTNYLGATSSSAYSITSSDYFLITQKIEGFNIADLGWGTVNAKSVTLSFQVYSSLTGTFGGVVANASGRSYPFAYTVSSANTWTSISVTIAGDTSGTWLTTNGVGLTLRFGLGVGATYSGTAGAWSSTSYFSATGAVSVVGTSGATFYITGVQLEVGSSATGFEYVNYQTSLANCQRYYWQCTDSMGVMTNTNNSYRTPMTMPVPMRTAPTLASGATFTVGGGSTGTPALNISSGSPATTTAVWIYNSSANWTAGNAVSLNAGFTAEL